MTPAASVSGFYFSHPQAKYFNVGRIGRDQAESYAQRSGIADRRGREVALAEPRLRACRRRHEVLKMRCAGRLLALVTFAVLGSARAALACSCIQSGPPCQAFWNAPLVFDAVAGAVDDERGVATLEVRKTWKGTVANRVVVPSGDGGGSCIYQFEAGQRYLVFAYLDPSNGRVRVSLCSATHKWDGSGNDAAFLASLSRPGTGGQVFGSVRRFTRSGGGIPDQAEIPIVTSVHLQSPAGVQSVKSAGGEFRFEGLAPGAYALSIDTPDGYIASPASAPLEILDTRGCATQSFSLTDNGRIAGRLLNFKGAPPTGLNVEVVTAGNIPVPAGSFHAPPSSRRIESFEAGGLPAGGSSWASTCSTCRIQASHTRAFCIRAARIPGPGSSP